MSFLKLLISLCLIVSCCYCDNNGNNGNNGNGRDNNGKSKNGRQGRWSRSKKKKIQNSEFKGSKFEEYPSIHEHNIPPKESFEEYKGNMKLLQVLDNGEQYETEFDENDAQTIFENLQQDNVDREFTQPCEDCDDNGETEPNVDLDLRRLYILGADTRFEITGTPITSIPSKYAGMLVTNSGRCSALQVGPRHIMTAGHCVHEGSGGDWFSNIRYYPRRNRLDTSTAYYWKTATSFTGWTVNGYWDWDIAIVELWVSPNLGWMSFGYDNGFSTSTYLSHKGYPGDKSYGSLWQTSDYIWQLFTHQMRTDDSDIYFGASGGMWYKYSSTFSRWVNYGVTSHQGYYTTGFWWWQTTYYYNSATRINSYKFEIFCNIIFGNC